MNRCLFFVLLALSNFSLATTVDKQPPQRLVSLSPHITELVFAAGGGERLVAVDSYSDWPIEVKQLPKIGDAFTLNIEYLVSLEPDLVFVWESGTSTEKVSQLERLNIPVSFIEPNGMNSIADDIERIGRLLGTATQAKKAAAEYRIQIDKLRREYVGKKVISLFYQVDEFPLYTIGGRHIVNEAIRLCGGHNVFDNHVAIAPPVSVEAVIKKNPQLIVASASSPEIQRRIHNQWKPLAFIPAVNNGQIAFVKPDWINRSGPRFPEGVSELCEVIGRAREKLKH